MAAKDSDLLDLDSALAELGMLAQPSTLRLEYLQDRERGCTRERGALTSLCRLPRAGLPDPGLLASSPRLHLNSQFVTNISVGQSDRLESEVRARRMSGPPAPWPRRSRILTSPYLCLPLPRLPGVILSPGHASLHRIRGRVRFKELSPACPAAYPLDEELTARLEAIKLDGRRGPQPGFSLGQAMSDPLCSEVKRLDLGSEEESGLVLSSEEEAV